MNIQKFKFHEKGLNRFFGPLEAKILDIMWDSPELSIKDVQKRLERDKKINFNTVMTVMNRLVDKGILQKRLSGRTSLYIPTSSKNEFLETQSRELTKDLIEEFGSVVVSHLLDSLDDVDEELLNKLEQKLDELKKDHD